MKIKYFVFFAFAIYTISGNSQEWQINYETALTAAKNQNKPILLVFSGSDWCAPCIKLDKEIWQSKFFKSYAKENYILYRADFPRKKNHKLSKELERQNKKLADFYNPNGYFPFVVILKNTKIVGQTGYMKMEPTEYVSHLNSFLK